MADPVAMPFGDPHNAPQDAEVTRVRSLSGAWRWLLIASAALTIFLCVNQQFTLKFFVGFTPLNTEYYYALILITLPFVFVVFPASERAPIDRVPWYDLLLFVLTALVSMYFIANIRKAAELGWEFGGAPETLVWLGFLMWGLLMEGLRRTIDSAQAAS